MINSNVSRRAFLRGAGTALALPMLDAMRPLRAEQAGVANDQPPPQRRLVAICTYLGMHGPYLFPAETGRDYQLTPYLDAIGEFRDQFTILSGLAHPAVDGGHSSVSSFLTAAPHPGSSSFKNSISLDQFAAERMGGDTRFPYLALSTNGGGLSWTRAGVRIPADDRPSRVFGKLFLQGSEEDLRQQMRRLKEGRSVMDSVRSQARLLERKLGKRDREKLAEYFSAVRELENRLPNRTTICSTEQWFYSVATWATPATTTRAACRSCWPAAASGTAGIWPSIGAITRRSAISTCRCSSDSDWMSTPSAPVAEPCRG